MKSSTILLYISIAACIALAVPAVTAQNSIQIFAPVNVQPSATGTGPGALAVTFNSSTLQLNCPSHAIQGVLSSTPDGKGNVLVDNDIQLTATSGGTVTGPVNVCRGGTSDSTPSGPSQDCYTASYPALANAGKLDGQDPDTFVATLGVAPIAISSNTYPLGTVQVKIDLVDIGGRLASSSLYLNSNCTLIGVTGPASISGNPISQTNPTQQQLTQTFAFNANPSQQVQLIYNLSQAQAAGTLSITPDTLPGTTDVPVDPNTFQSTLVPNTSFATSSCLIHTGELLNGAPACKLYTLECSIGTGSTSSGAQCPVSSLPNEIFQDVFDGPAFTLPDISTPSGTTFHQGIGFLMASEGWTGGPCTFDPASGLQDLPCPQNLLSTFSGPGLYIATGKTSHPNSTFIPVVQVPEDLTTVVVAGQGLGGWINKSTATVTLSSQPPVLTGTTVPGAANFVASPIQSITYGISAANSAPVPTAPPSTDTVVDNTIPCPGPQNPLDPPATVFTTTPQTISGLADGKHLLHYYAQDCAGTRELQFNQDSGGNWSTVYYTFPINVDTIAPVVASGPVLSPPPDRSHTYRINQDVTASYRCTDERSGVVRCGSSTYSPTADVLDTGILTSPVDASTPGVKTYTVMAIDAAGNQSSVSVQYVVSHERCGDPDDGGDQDGYQCKCRPSH
jgi:hypothetical protein